MQKKSTSSSLVVSKKEVAVLTRTATKRAEELLAQIATSKGRIAQEFYSLGTALRELLRKKLFVTLGCKTFVEMLEQHGVMGKSQAYKLIDVVENYSKRQALELGLEKAHGLVRLAAATAAAETGADIVRVGAVVRGQRRGVEKLSAAEIVREARRTRQLRKNARRDPARHAAEEIARSTEKQLRARGVSKATVVARKGKGGWMARVECEVADLRKLLSDGGGAVLRSRG